MKMFIELFNGTSDTKSSGHLISPLVAPCPKLGQNRKRFRNLAREKEKGLKNTVGRDDCAKGRRTAGK